MYPGSLENFNCFIFNPSRNKMRLHYITSLSKKQLKSYKIQLNIFVSNRIVSSIFDTLRAKRRWSCDSEWSHLPQLPPFQLEYRKTVPLCKYFQPFVVLAVCSKKRCKAHVNILIPNESRLFRSLPPHRGSIDTRLLRFLVVLCEVHALRVFVESEERFTFRSIFLKTTHHLVEIFYIIHHVF